MICTLTMTSYISLLRHTSDSGHTLSSVQISYLTMALAGMYPPCCCTFYQFLILFFILQVWETSNPWSTDVVCYFFLEQHLCVLRPHLQMLDPPLQGCLLFVVMIHVWHLVLSVLYHMLLASKWTHFLLQKFGLNQAPWFGQFAGGTSIGWSFTLSLPSQYRHLPVLALHYGFTYGKPDLTILALQALALFQRLWLYRTRMASTMCLSSCMFFVWDDTCKFMI